MEVRMEGWRERVCEGGGGDGQLGHAKANLSTLSVLPGPHHDL